MMIEWIGIICCSSVISCMCSLLATTFCLSPTGGRVREKLTRRIKVKNQNDLLQFPRIPENKKIPEDEETSQGKSPLYNVVPETLFRIRSNSDSEKNQSREFAEHESQIGEPQSISIEKQPINLQKENLKNPSPSPLCKNSRIPTSFFRDVPTETEIRKTLDDFNAVFQQYSELISRNMKQDFNNKKSQSSVKFEIPNTSQKTTNMGTMTETQDFQFFDSKSNSKIKKCKCKKNKKGLRKNVSTQSFKSVRSCTCSFAKSDLDPRKTESFKNVKSNSAIKLPRDSNHRLTSKTSWISKTVRRFRFKNDRKEKFRCRCPDDDRKIRNSSNTNVR